MTGKQKSLMLIAAAFLFLAVLPISPVFGWSPFKAKASNASFSQIGEGILGVTKTSEGDVSVNLTPVSYEDGILTVKISIDTHSINDLYKYDLSKITSLNIGSMIVKPTRAPRLGGHHNNGKYEFKVDQLTAKGFSITINGLNSPGTREFIWP